MGIFNSKQIQEPVQTKNIGELLIKNPQVLVKRLLFKTVNSQNKFHYHASISELRDKVSFIPNQIIQFEIDFSENRKKSTKTKNGKYEEI